MADVVPVEVVEVGVERELGERVALGAGIFTEKSPKPNGGDALLVVSDIATSVLAGCQITAVDTAAAKRECARTMIDERDGRFAVALCATVDAARRAAGGLTAEARAAALACVAAQARAAAL